MVLKPLCVLADGLCASGGLQVLVFHDALPRTFQSEWVAIYLDETIDKIDQSLMLFHPGDAVSVKVDEVACVVILHQEVDDVTLLFVLGKLLRPSQPRHNLLDGSAIHTILMPSKFHHLAIALEEFRVQAIRRWSQVIGILHLAIESLHLFLGDALIEVASRSLHEVLAIRLVDTLWQDVLIEDDCRASLPCSPHVSAEDAPR